MNCCYQIEVCNPCEGVPEYFLTENGTVILDVLPNSDIEILKNTGELTDINQIKIDAILALTLPMSDLNKTVLSNYFQLGAIDRDVEPLEIRFTVSGEIMPFRYLTAKSVNHEACTYDLEVSYEDDHWAKSAKDCKLCDIQDLPDFTLNLQNIQDTWDPFVAGGGMNWAPGLPIFMFPPVNYGVGISTARNYRPWWSVPGTMKALFKKIGWKLDAPILDSFFADKWMYLSSGEYGEPKGIDLNQYKFFATEQSFQHNGGVFSLTELYDNPGAYNNPEYTGNNSLEEELCVEFSFVNVQFDDYLQIIKEDSNGDKTVLADYDFERDLGVGGNGNVRATICTPCGPTDSNCKYYVESSFTGSVSYIKFYNRPKRYRYNNGTVIPLAETLDCDCSLLDLLKAILHFFNGKIETDFCTKCVRIYPPFDVKCGDQLIEGFYKLNEPVDITEMILCDSGIFSTPDLRNKESICIYGFKESSDPQFENTINGDQQIYDAVIQTDGLSGETKVKRNPLFEPSAIQDYPEFGGTVNSIPHLPTLLDNEDGEESFDLGKRIMCFAHVQQIHATGTPSPILFDNGPFNFYPTGFQSLSGEDFSFFNYTPEGQFIYGDSRFLSETNVLYCKFYEENERNRSSNSGSFDLYLCPGDCQGWSFRNLLCGTYNGIPFNIYGDELLGSVCNNQGTLIFTEEYKTFIKAPSAGVGGVVVVTK